MERTRCTGSMAKAGGGSIPPVRFGLPALLGPARDAGVRDERRWDRERRQHAASSAEDGVQIPGVPFDESRMTPLSPFEWGGRHGNPPVPERMRMDVITLKHLSHLPQGKPYLMVGMIASEEEARAEGERYGAKAVYYWQKTHSAYLYIPKDESDDVHEAL